NWPAAVGIFTGVLAKEAVVGTLNAAYTALADSASAEKEKQPFVLADSLTAAAATIPVNLSEALAAWLDPLGLDIGDVHNQAAVAEKAEISTGIFGAMASRFDGKAGAFAYLLFILLYMPCTAAIAAVYQESGRAWTVFVALWTTGLGYGIATLYYQLATFAHHPDSALAWISIIMALFAAVLLSLRYLGMREKTSMPAIQQSYR
ncbi:nucleoside recognition domain-containing protein, partial [Methylomonas rivi]